MNNLYKKIYEAINTGMSNALSVNEDLIITDDSAQDVSVKWKESQVTADFNMMNYYVNCIINGENVYNEIIDLYHNYNYCYKVKSKENLKDIIIGCTKCNLQCDLNWIDVSDITDMSYLFSPNEYRGQTKFDLVKILKKFNGDISKWNVSNVTNMSHMFHKSSFTGDISKWNVSKVTDMSRMFRKSVFSNDISGWDTSSVRNMRGMFYESVFNGDISKWNVLNVRNMSDLFGMSNFNQDISGWLTLPNKVTNMSGMFYMSSYKHVLSEWNVSNVTNMNNMFYGNTVFNGDISKWLVKPNKVKHMYQMFMKSSFNGDISEWDVSNVKDMQWMFAMSEFDKPIKNWKVLPDADFSYMFYCCSFSQNISSWVINNKSNTYNMFYGNYAMPEKYKPQILKKNKL